MADLGTPLVLSIFIVGLLVAYFVGVRSGSRARDLHWEAEIPLHRKDAISKSRAVLGGQFSEQLAPYLPDFPFSPTECRFIGKPIDFLVFSGMDEKAISEVVFVEVKSGDAQLSAPEKKLKEAILGKRIRYVEYRVPESITKKFEEKN